MSLGEAEEKLSLSRWLWRVFVQGALIPLILVETVLIAAYLISNQSVRDAQVDYLHRTAASDLRNAVSQQAFFVEGQLAQVGRQAQLLATMTEQALTDTVPSERERLVRDQGGVLYSPEDKGGAASFYSASADKHDLEKVARLSRLDPLMASLAAEPLIVSAYFNSWDSYNRIYPWFRTLDQYPSDMVIPNYNFYYLADAEHNPGRGQVWTDVYLDPAGHGWMMSAIAPVYQGSFLEGVAGVDITVGGLVERLGELDVPWNGYLVMIGDDLSIMALPKAGERDFGLQELTKHSYNEAIRSEQLKPEDFKLDKREQTRALADAMTLQQTGSLALTLEGRKLLMAWHQVDSTGWQVLAVVDEAAVVSQTNALAGYYQRIGVWLIVGLIVFYAAFFVFMWYRARQLGHELRDPIDGVSEMMRLIGSGDRAPPRPRTAIAEFHNMASQALTMGRQLAESEAVQDEIQARLEFVLDNATEGLWECSVARREFRFNGKFCRRFGLPEGPVDADRVLGAILPADRSIAIAALETMQSPDTLTRGLEFRVLDQAGTPVWILCYGRVMKREPVSGAPLFVIGTGIDIDDMKQVESELRQRTIEALAASQAKSRFISSMSHEFKTPLNAIHGFAQLMKLDAEFSGKGGENDAIDEILVASRHLAQLVDDLLAWSSLQAEKPQLRCGPVDPWPIMLEAIEMQRRELEAGGLRVEWNCPAERPMAIADSRRLRQILINLISNAIKYNAPGGFIEVGLEPREAGSVRLYVRDSGEGIEPSKRPLLFEPFQRLGKENTAIPGTGIGLALCQELAQLMQGCIGFHSEPGKGSCFWIDLPSHSGVGQLESPV